jgi:hypothetical protein
MTMVGLMIHLPRAGEYQIDHPDGSLCGDSETFVVGTIESYVAELSTCPDGLSLGALFVIVLVSDCHRREKLLSDKRMDASELVGSVDYL